MPCVPAGYRLAITRTGGVVDMGEAVSDVSVCERRVVQRLRVRAVLYGDMLQTTVVDGTMVTRQRSPNYPLAIDSFISQNLLVVVRSGRGSRVIECAMHKLFAWQVSKVAAREYAFGSSSIQGRRPSQEDRALGCISMVKVPPWQCPQLGSCAS